MYSNNLRSLLTDLAKKAQWSATPPVHASILPRQSAVIFKDLKDNFHLESHKAIDTHTTWPARLRKPHSSFPNGSGILEMHSSNSSDALTMNIFCHPQLPTWKGLAQLFNVPAITDIDFGYNPVLLKNGVKETTPTEVDLYLNHSIICEAKLTESDFTEKAKTTVDSYDDFSTVFEISALKQSQDSYYNYQLIRNILAAYAEGKQFFLLCDARRPDLVRSFYETVRCVKDVNLRLRCNVLYWQDIAAMCGQNLKNFLKAKYGI